jgi:hypothetical protein
MDEKMARLIVYERNEFYFLAGKLNGFRLQDSKFSIGNGESFSKVGDHYSLVEKIFPTFQISEGIDYSSGKTYGLILIPISNQDIISDEPIAIVFDLETGKITEIHI